MMENQSSTKDEPDTSVSVLPANTRRFEKSSIVPATLEAVTRFHEAPRALARLTPPPILMQLHRDDRRSLTDGEIEFTLWFGPLPFRWIARHEPGPTPHSFVDSQIKGPLAFWRHEHIFTAVVGGVELTDRITLAHRRNLLGLFTRLAFDGLPLHILFAFRHWRTRRALRGASILAA